MTVLGKWEPMYKNVTEPWPYLIDGSDETYRLGAALLQGMLVEDWGCGLGWFKTFHDGLCIGIDGTPSVGADIVEDLATRETSTPGLFMRHVLEHNENWEEILSNAVASFTKRLVLVLYTPLQEETRLIQQCGIGVVELGLALKDILAILPEGVEVRSVGSETVFVCDR